MKANRNRKKNLIVSYKNLSEELKELFKERYPEGYNDYLQRFEKPNGEVIFVAPMETDDTVYMVKFDVKIDTTYTDDDIDKDYYDEEVEKADQEFAPLQEAIDKEEEDPSHTERVVRHGNYDDELDTGKKKSKIVHGSLSALGEELQEAFSDDGSDSYDEYPDKDEEEDEEEDFEEPTDEELMDIDSEIFANAEIPPEELARMEAEKAAAEAAKPKKGRPRKNAQPANAEPATPKKKGRPRKE
ncbi:MAG: hypothetical protein IJK84_00805 [Bacteroidales bacterium]|nr:hypothetical protein [Bacteroidales bacterium]